MGFKCGIIGLPNVGKSTLFNAMTEAGIAAENYPFCTIEPNIGIVSVPDKRLEALAEIVKPMKVIPATMQFVDIAGLVKGAAQGEGLGNQFLANIRETDAIAHVVRCFENDDVVHVSNKINPVDDIEIINTELALADLETLTKAMQKLQKHAKGGDKNALKSLAVLEKIQPTLEMGEMIRTIDLSQEDKKILASFHFLTSKPTMYIANIDDHATLSENKHYQSVIEFAKKDNANVVPISAAIESEIAELNESDKADFLTELNLTEPGLNRIIRAGYDLLNLETYFTAGKKEVRAWTLAKNSQAPQAAAVIHTDFEKGFIRAEVIAYEDYIQYQGEQGAKEAGKMRSEGKDYTVKDGDVIYFRFNVS